MLPIRLKPAPPNVPTRQFGQLVGYMCVGDRPKLRPWVGVDAANAHRPPCASRSDVRQRRSREVPEGYTQQGRGPSLAAGPLPLLYERIAIAAPHADAARRHLSE